MAELKPCEVARMTLQEHIKNLEQKVEQSRNRITQAEKQYQYSLAKLEHQKQAVEETRKNIDQVKIRVAQRLMQLQIYREALKRKKNVEISDNLASLGSESQTYCFTVKLENPIKSSELFANIAEPVKL